MAPARPGRSTASRVFLVLLSSVVAVGVLVAASLIAEEQRATRAEAERATGAASQAIASSPAVVDGLSDEDIATATGRLEPYAREVVARAGVDFVTIMTPDGTRITHPNPVEIGGRYLGTIPGSPRVLTEEFRGTLGPSVRTIAPVLDHGSLVGWVAAGVTTETITETLVRRLPLSLGFTAGLLVLGLAGALIARRLTRRVAGDLPPGQLRDAVSSYESIRTLGEALRAQTHEHGNRLHTAVALIELGRTTDAVELLTESARQSQALVDQVTARRHGDPAIAALLLGKASQAKERGIAWRVHVDPATPRTPLSPVDAVSVLGNLIDNALDAAAMSVERWVAVTLRPADDGGILLEVGDSGPGIGSDAERIFARGYTTKAADPHSRGIGLALVRSLVDAVGGSVTVEGPPTMFRVVLPPTGQRSRGR